MPPGCTDKFFHVLEGQKSGKIGKAWKSMEQCENSIFQDFAKVAFVETLLTSSAVERARCVFIVQTFANEKSGNTTRRNVEELDDRCLAAAICTSLV